ncbi:MAG: FliM/FliN family flagellar motor switch protein [Pseudomonadota bacterium]
MENEQLIIVDEESGVTQGERTSDGVAERILRSQSQRKMELVSEIDEQAKLLEGAIQEKVSKFVGITSKVRFREMSMFEVDSVIGQNSTNSLFLFEGDELPIVFFYFENNLFQELLSITISGDAKSAKDGQPLSDGEKALFIVFISLMGAGFFEVADVFSEYGIPKKPVFYEPKYLKEYEGLQDFVSLTFDISAAETTGECKLITSLSVFDHREKQSGSHATNDETSEEDIWSDKLFDRIQDVPVPLNVELGSVEMFLSEVNALQPGQTLKLPINPEEMKLFTDAGEFLLSGSLQVDREDLKFRVMKRAE